MPAAPRHPRLLVVSPAFHGYWHALEDAFARLGWEVATLRYDEHVRLSDKLAVKLRGELPRLVGRREDAALAEAASRRARTAVHTFHPDRVLVVKGDLLTDTFWDALDRPRVPRTIWLYDELRRTRYTDAALGRADAVASYSRQDCAALAAAGHRVLHVPLGFDTTTAFVPLHRGDVTFIGARYPQRAALLEHLHRAGVPVRAFGRDWSHHWFDRGRTWRLTAPEFGTGRDLSREETYGVMAGGPATLNIHGDQDGFTMRTFEASGVGAVQVVDRPDVAEFYDPDAEVAVFTSPEELVELARRAIADDRWGDRLRAAARARTLAEHTFVHRARALATQWD